MAADALAGDWIELPASVVAAMSAELPAPASGSPLEPLRGASSDPLADWQQALAERGLTEDGELVPWLARAMSVLMWPEAVVRTQDTVVSAPAIRCVAADTLVRYEQAQGLCVIGHPTTRDDFVDELVALTTTTLDRVGEPPVLQLTRWSLQAIETVLATDRTHAAARAALAALTSDPDGPQAVLDAMVGDGLLIDDGARFAPGAAIEDWHDALDSRRRLELQRLDLADGPEAQVSTMVFIGNPGDRCLIVPEGGDQLLLVRPTTDEATALIDAFLTPAPPADAQDEFLSVAEAWRASADALISGRQR